MSAGVGCHPEGPVEKPSFHGRSECWQNSIPGGCSTEVPAFWLALGHPLVLTHDPPYVQSQTWNVKSFSPFRNLFELPFCDQLGKTLTLQRAPTILLGSPDSLLFDELKVS